jgi:hypothetical protein
MELSYRGYKFPSKQVFKIHKYSRFSITWHVWGLGCAGYMKMQVTGEKLLQKKLNKKSKEHIFSFVLAWESF